MPDLREKRVELILQQLEELPTLPAVAVRVLEVTASDKSSAEQVVSLIASDVSLTTRILQLVQRADVGARGNLTSLQRAVMLLGFDAVRSAVLAISVFQTFDHEPSAGTGANAAPFNRAEFWKHCIATACCAELLAESIGDSAGADAIKPCDAFVCGLLHDMGKVALDTVLPKSFNRVVEAADLLRADIADLERQVIGLDHMVVGKRLAERWRLPDIIRDCAWLHGQSAQSLPANVRQPRLVHLITLADALVRRQHLGYSGNYAFPVGDETLAHAAGISMEQVGSALRQLVTRVEPRARALGLEQASGTELYRQALAQANKELGRVSTLLAAKNRRLGVRSKFFDALSQFQSELRPDAAPQLVLRAIAQTAVAVLGAPVAAAFSLPPGHDYAETVLCNSAGEVIDTSLIDLPGLSQVLEGASMRAAPPRDAIAGGAHELATAAPVPTGGAESGAAAESSRPGNPEAGDGPVLPVGPDLEWLVGAVSPRLSHDRRFWICLQADGACVGGVIWGAESGESQRLSPQAQELLAMANGWSLALRTAQVREEARTLAEQLADSNRHLQRAQGELLRSKAMLAVGEMAAGAAHEMNNPLAVISGRSQLLASQLTDPRHKAMAHLIHEQSHRLSAIITELMDFAKPEPPTVRDCDLPDMVERALHEAKTHNDPADRVIEVTMGDVPPVAVDEKQVSAAMTEVIDNAIHATDPSSGHVAVHAGYDPCSSRVVVTIADNGCGMDEQTVKRAFDPFFSNKPAGRRRGLGLAKALRWVEASGGSIRLESRPGQGTRAVLLLPAAAGAAAAGEPAVDQRRPRRAAQ